MHVFQLAHLACGEMVAQYLLHCCCQFLSSIVVFAGSRKMLSRPDITTLIFAAASAAAGWSCPGNGPGPGNEDVSTKVVVECAATTGGRLATAGGGGQQLPTATEPDLATKFAGFAGPQRLSLLRQYRNSQPPIRRCMRPATASMAGENETLPLGEHVMLAPLLQPPSSPERETYDVAFEPLGHHSPM